MCETSENGDQKKRERKESDLNDHIHEPFLEHKFEPLGWRGFLATVTICKNDVTPTLFCDKEGYDIILVQIVNFLNIQEENNPNFKAINRALFRSRSESCQIRK